MTEISSQLKCQVRDELQMLKRRMDTINQEQMTILKAFMEESMRSNQKIEKVLEKNDLLTQRVDILEEENRELKNKLKQLYYVNEKFNNDGDNLHVKKNQGNNETNQDIPTEIIVNSQFKLIPIKNQVQLIKQTSSTRKQAFIYTEQQQIKPSEVKFKQQDYTQKQQQNSSQSQNQSSSSQQQSIFDNFIYSQAEKVINNNKKLRTIKNNIEQKYNQFQEIKQTTEKSKLKLQEVDVKINQLETQQKQILSKYQEDLKTMQNYSQKLKQKITALKVNGSQTKNLEKKTIMENLQKIEQQNLLIDELIAHYAQSMFWLMNSYFLSFRIMKTQMFKQDQSVWESKTSSILKNIKKVIGLFTKVQIIKTGLQIVSYLIGIYLDQESQMFNQKMYQFVTEQFFNQKDINEAISQAIIMLIEEKYIKRKIIQVQTQIEQEKQNKGKMMINKTKAWYEKKKSQILQSISGLSQQKRSDMKNRLQIIVMDDLAKIFAYIALNKMAQIKRDKNNDKVQQTILTTIFQQALTKQKMESRLVKIYKKSTNQQHQNINKKKSNQNGKCIIY